MANQRRNPPVSSVPHQPTISPELAIKRLQKLLDTIPDIRRFGHRSAAYSTWHSNVKIVLSEFYGENSRMFKEFGKIWFSPGAYYKGQPESEFEKAFTSGLGEATGFLQSRINDLSETVSEPIGRGSATQEHRLSGTSREIFVVHGHDHGKLETVARFLGRLELEPIILHEQADKGRTLVEKFESHASGVNCAVIILTADDIAYAKSKPDETEHRARQNVVFELGYFVGRLGRQRTFALVERGITLPSDIHGVVYIPLDDGEWRIRLVRELKAAGFEIDANMAF